VVAAGGGGGTAAGLTALGFLTLLACQKAVGPPSAIHSFDDHDARGHDAVGHAADLGALDVVLPVSVGLNQPLMIAPGNRVLLQPERRHREAVEHVAAGELEVVGLADLDVQLVDRADVVGVSSFPSGPGCTKRPRPLLRHDADSSSTSGMVILTSCHTFSAHEDDGDVEDQRQVVRVW
jgi:hypothetical protein